MDTIEILSLASGPWDLEAQLPATATLSRRLPDSGGWEIWLVRFTDPLRYHIPAGANPKAAGVAVELDEDGQYVWVAGAALACPSPLCESSGELTVQIAYVLDPDSVRDSDLNDGNIGLVGEVVITRIEAPRTVHPPLFAAPAPDMSPARVENLLPAPPVSEFESVLAEWIARLAEVAGEHPGHVQALIPAVDASSGYMPAELTYNAPDSHGDMRARTAETPDELLYWIVDDVAAELSWQWVCRAPSFDDNDPEAARRLWMARWHTLMAALSAEWGEQTPFV